MSSDPTYAGQLSDADAVHGKHLAVHGRPSPTTAAPPATSALLNYDPADPEKMRLPAGVTCGDCAHIRRCKTMFGHTETDTYCDWSPSRFRAAVKEAGAPTTHTEAAVAIAINSAIHRIEHGDAQSALEPLREAACVLSSAARRSAAAATAAERYEWLRSRDLTTIHEGGVFAGKTPDNVVLNGADLDAAIDAERRRY